MIYEEVKLLVPYTESYVPEGRRKVFHVNFPSELPVKIHRIEAEDAPPAYRIVEFVRGSERNSYFVRSFANSLWWPITDWSSDSNAVVPVSSAKFVELAGQGHPTLLEMLGVSVGSPVEKSRDEYYRRKPYKRIVGSTLEQQWVRAQRGAMERIVFVDDMVFLEAGEPIYFVGDGSITAGSCSLDRPLSLRDHGDLRKPRAREGLAFAIEEIDDEIRTFDDFEEIEFVHTAKIEPLVERFRSDAAALTCAHALIESQWIYLTLNCAGGRKLREGVPALATPGLDIRTAKQNYKTILEQIKAMPNGTGREFRYLTSRASSILRRLDSFSSAPLTEEDEAALSILGSSQ
jgi:hypothetical protein